MGRSVSTPRDALLIEYQDVLEIETWTEWQDFCEEIMSQAVEHWGEFRRCDGWLGREDRILLENTFAYFGISEYCGLAAIWIAHKEDFETLATGWARMIGPKFARTFGEMDKLGTMSNGEAVFQHRA